MLTVRNPCARHLHSKRFVLSLSALVCMALTWHVGGHAGFYLPGRIIYEMGCHSYWWRSSGINRGMFARAQRLESGTAREQAISTPEGMRRISFRGERHLA